jgi:ATP-dependent RNA helicase SUPV3L1/SUV3
MEWQQRSRVTAVLGPTNTGKTHLAIERMLGHASGMIGFPLRLLARENYDRIVKLKGARQVALITGEERLVPPQPRYFVCTVEAMPLDRPVEFLAVDEVQLASDWERGHVFTDRILHARGLAETMLVGAETIKPIIRRLVRDAEFVTRPRFSQLTYTGPQKLTRLPRRSAVVAFSAAEVYAMAELMRRQRGGCAVVLGALSPRARNAQVAMYQAGEVDWLVATDAIGMGLNMDLDHVAFARLSKFDGRGPRRLSAPEIAQIAGRAGRHMNDGSFGTTAELGPLDAELVEAVENHEFEPIASVSWRNSDLDFRSVAALMRSLEAPASLRELNRKRDAEDHAALAILARRDDVAARATTRDAVRLLWEVCQIPDFRKTMADVHARLIGQIYLHLTGPGGRLPADWVGAQIARLDRTDGDIDTLSARIAHIRTWTYVSHRGDWLGDAAHWQERTRAIEDKLSDALHDRLTQRFVDKRGAHLGKRLKDAEALLGGVTRDGEVVVEGHPVGRLDGFKFVPDAAESGEAARQLVAAARRVLATEIAARVRALTTDADKAFKLTGAARIVWRGTEIARLARGPSVFAPAVEVMTSDLVSAEQRERIRAHLTAWTAREIERRLPALFAARRAALSGAARGLVYQLAEALGTLARAGLEPQLAALTDDDRRQLGALGVRLGVESIYLKPLLAPATMAFRALLYALARGLKPPRLGDLARPSRRCDPALPAELYEAAGLRVLGARALRPEALERFAQQLRTLAKQGPFAPTAALGSAIDAELAELIGLIRALGYRITPTPSAGAGDAAPAQVTIGARRRRRGAAARPGHDPAESPFAKLKEHRLARR